MGNRKGQKGNDVHRIGLIQMAHCGLGEEISKFADGKPSLDLFKGKMLELNTSANDF